MHNQFPLQQTSCRAERGTRAPQSHRSSVAWPMSCPVSSRSVNYNTTLLLEPISKSPEEDNEASELYEAEEVLGVVFPTDEDAALPLNPSKEALHEPASHIAA